MNFKEKFKNNALYLTDYSKPTLVDAVRAIYNLCGKNFPESSATKIIKEKISVRKHILFILSDGMGSNLIDKLDNTSILKRNNIMDLQTVNPSTTGCAIPSILTGEYPSTHGMLGWLSYNRTRNLEYLPVLFLERKSGKSLKEFNVNENEIYVTKSALNTLNRKTFAFFPEGMENSPFSTFALDSGERIAYSNIHNAFQKYSERILTLDEYTYTYMYIPDIDTAEHKYGVFSEEVLKILTTLENELTNLSSKSSNLEIIITADHGQTDVTQKPIIMKLEKYNKYFYALPGIDYGTATYYVKNELKQDFEKEFNKDYDKKMFLFDIKDAIDNNVFGNEVLSSYMKSNLGEYISFCKKGSYFINTIEEDEELRSLKGTHSGFSKDEIIIPLIIINS